MKRGLFFGLGLFLIIILTQCGTGKRVKREPIRDLGAEFLLQKLSENEIKYNTISAKFKANYVVDKRSTSVNGQFRIKKDSIIWLSITPAMGIEVARLLITPDTVKVINRIDKTFLVTDFRFINAFLNNAVDFDMLQSLLLGNDFSFYENNNWKASWDEGVYKLATSKRRKLKKYVKEKSGTFLNSNSKYLA